MPGKRIIILLLLASSASLQLSAQRARYATIPVSYDVKIPEKNGVFLHAWGASAKPSYTQSQAITLTLYIFTPDLRLLAHRNLRLGKIRSWSMDFQYSDSCYYASIWYNADSLYHVLVKVTNDGTVTDVGDQPELWQRKEFPRQVNKVFALERCNDNLYTIKIENPDTAAGSPDQNVIPLEKDPVFSWQSLQRIVIKKTNLKTKEESKKI